jgi:hypothetical protein
MSDLLRVRGYGKSYVLVGLTVDGERNPAGEYVLVPAARWDEAPRVWWCRRDRIVCDPGWDNAGVRDESLCSGDPGPDGRMYGLNDHPSAASGCSWVRLVETE